MARMGWLLATESIIAALAAAPIGVIADRFDRRRIILVTEFARVLLIVVAALAWQSDVGTIGPFVFMALLGVLTATHEAVKTALVPTLVGVDPERMDRFNVAQRFAIQLVIIGGPLAAGELVERFGLGRALLLAVPFALLGGITYAATLPAQPPTPPEEGSPPAGFFRQVAGGLQSLAGSPLLLTLCCLGALMSAVMPVFVTLWLPAHVRELGRSARALGFARATAAGAGLAGTVAYGIVSRNRPVQRLKMLAIGQFVFAGLLLSLFGWRSYAGLLFVLVVSDLIGGAMMVAFQTLFFVNVPEEVRGRVFAAAGGLASLAAPLGFAASAFLLSTSNASSLLLALAVLVGAGGVPLLFLRAAQSSPSASERR